MSEETESMQSPNADSLDKIESKVIESPLTHPAVVNSSTSEHLTFDKVVVDNYVPEIFGSSVLLTGNDAAITTNISDDATTNVTVPVTDANEQHFKENASDATKAAVMDTIVPAAHDVQELSDKATLHSEAAFQSVKSMELPSNIYNPFMYATETVEPSVDRASVEAGRLTNIEELTSADNGAKVSEAAVVVPDEKNVDAKSASAACSAVGSAESANDEKDSHSSRRDDGSDRHRSDRRRRDEDDRYRRDDNERDRRDDSERDRDRRDDSEKDRDRHNGSERDNRRESKRGELHGEGDGGSEGSSSRRPNSDDRWERRGRDDRSRSERRGGDDRRDDRRGDYRNDDRPRERDRERDRERERSSGYRDRDGRRREPSEERHDNRSNQNRSGRGPRDIDEFGRIPHQSASPSPPPSRNVIPLMSLKFSPKRGDVSQSPAAKGRDDRSRDRGDRSDRDRGDRDRSDTPQQQSMSRRKRSRWQQDDNGDAEQGSGSRPRTSSTEAPSRIDSSMFQQPPPALPFGLMPGMPGMNAPAAPSLIHLESMEESPPNSPSPMLGMGSQFQQHAAHQALQLQQLMHPQLPMMLPPGMQGMQLPGSQGLTLVGNQSLAGLPSFAGAPGMSMARPPGLTMAGLQALAGQQGLPEGLTLAGPQGFQSMAGPHGLQAIVGPQGLQGLGGSQGLQSLGGPQGLQGIGGPQGLQAVSGSQGLQSLGGPQGLQTIAGPQGLQALSGSQGMQAVSGPQGIQISGPQGFTISGSQALAMAGSQGMPGGPPGLPMGGLRPLLVNEHGVPMQAVMVPGQGMAIVPQLRQPILVNMPLRGPHPFLPAGMSAQLGMQGARLFLPQGLHPDGGQLIIGEGGLPVGLGQQMLHSHLLNAQALAQSQASPENMFIEEDEEDYENEIMQQLEADGFNAHEPPPNLPGLHPLQQLQQQPPRLPEGLFPGSIPLPPTSMPPPPVVLRPVSREDSGSAASVSHLLGKPLSTGSILGRPPSTDSEHAALMARPPPMWKPDQQFQIPGLGMQPNAASIAVPQKLDSALLSSLNVMPEAIKSRETPPFNMADIRPPMVNTASNVMNMLSGMKQLQSANVTNQESKLTDIPLPSTFHSSSESSNARAQGQVDSAATSYAPPKANFDSGEKPPTVADILQRLTNSLPPLVQKTATSLNDGDNNSRPNVSNSVTPSNSVQSLLSMISNSSGSVKSVSASGANSQDTWSSFVATDNGKQAQKASGVKSHITKQSSDTKLAVSEDDFGEADKSSLNDQLTSASKLSRQQRVEEEVKLALKPFYNKGEVNKDQYKDIMRKAVPKICHSKSGDINPAKIQSYVAACVAQMDGGQGQQQQKPAGKSSDESKSKQASQAKKNPAASYSPNSLTNKTASKSGNSNNSKSKTADKSAKTVSNDDVSKLLKHVST